MADQMSKRDEVIYSFAVEAEHTPEVLAEYQKQFPEFADELLTHYHEYLRMADEPEDDRELTPEEEAENEAYVQKAWERHKAAMNAFVPYIPFEVSGSWYFRNSQRDICGPWNSKDEAEQEIEKVKGEGK